MKIVTMLSFIIITGSIIITFPVSAQTVQEDSEAAINNAVDNAQFEKDLNKERQDDADALRKETKGKEKEAKRIEDDASDASKQARISAKRERQAQKARESAEKQNKKAAKAAEKSDANN